MAETLISPGVLARENDSSFVSKRPVIVGAAIIGPTVKGPVEAPVVCTTYSQFTTLFGTTFVSGGVDDSQNYSYFTSIAAYNYFINGGTSLLVARVVSGSYSAATSSKVDNAISSIPGNPATGSFVFSTVAQTGSYVASALTIGNNIYYFAPASFSSPNPSLDYYYFNVNNTSNWNINQWGAALSLAINDPAFNTSVYVSASWNAATNKLILSGSDGDVFINGTNLYSSGYIGTPTSNMTLVATLSGATPSQTSETLILETLSEGIIMNSDSTEIDGALQSGSADNVRWQITNANTSSGTFDLLVRRGNDNTLSPTVLETWTNLSLDPLAGNYISRVIGDQVENYNSLNNQMEISGSYANRSNYIRVKQVLYTTPNYFDNNGIAKSQYTASIPLNASGAFGGAVGNIMGGANFYDKIDEATNSQGLVGSDYNNMIALLDNKDDYQFNILLTPGLYDQGNFAGQISSIIANTQNRGDNIFVLDPVAYNSSISTVVSTAASRNSSYAAEYWPWCQIVDPGTGNLAWVPASTVIAGVYAYNDSVSEPWFAPAGINRGGLSQVVRAERKLSQGNRDTLYTGKVNPIATFPGTGVVVYGQKTLQTRASALDRVNVRRLLIALKSYISQVANNLVFEQNTIATRNQFLSQVNPYLTSVQQRQGLYAYKVIMDDSNNTPDVIDRNELIGQIYLQPTKTAEFIYLDFNVTPTGATFPA